MSVRIAINGFGRIGRALFRVLSEREGVEIVAINDLHDEGVLAHLLRYDSVHGPLKAPVELRAGAICVDGRKVKVLRTPEPDKLPWAELGVELVFECTGRFTGRGCARIHLNVGAKLVIVSAPAADADLTLVMGVNHQLYDPSRHFVVSNASCTTNCLAPVAKTLHEAFGIAKGLVTTVHAYTNDQMLLDHAHRDLRRARSAALSIIPTTTGAAAAVGEVLPELAGRLDGVSVRVPTPDVSLADITLSLETTAGAEAVNQALADAAAGSLEGILGYTRDPLVSVDYVRCPYSAVVDGLQTRLVGGDLVKVSAWYDNEWGYANRLVELMEYMTRVQAARQFGT